MAEETAALKVTAAERCEARLTERLGGDKAGNAATILMIFEAIMEFIQRCRENKAERLTARIAKSGGRRQAIMARRARRDVDGDLTRRQARDGVLAVVAEARANPKDTAAMFAECRAEMEED